jgi:cyclopropane-fatty-acyl-phospholipid synthase
MNTRAQTLVGHEKTPRGAALLLPMLDEMRGGSINLHLPNGIAVLCGDAHLVANLHVHDWAMLDRVITKGSIGFAESWMAGEWDTDHLADLLTLIVKNRAVLERAIHGDALRLVFHRLWHTLRANTRKGSRRNIEAHYDLGNDFYKLWLDESMTYSSAVYATPETSLTEAQHEKYRSILRRLDARPGQHILEVGCGWGGFAEIASLEFGCHVTGITLSPAQLAWAQARAERGGFAANVTLELRDYRDMTGEFDHVVSIEMIEAVGEKFWPTYFKKLHDCVALGGRVVIQGISIAHELFAHYRRDVDFIQRYIFPGGMLFSPQILTREAERANLKVVSDTPFGLDYARTLAEWMQRFNAAREHVLAQGFDERFIRMWQFYLAYCEAGFRAGSTNVHHFELVRST